jgi:hypothetical protein
MRSRWLAIGVLWFFPSIASSPASAERYTHISIPASSCRWDPIYDTNVHTGSVANKYFIAVQGQRVPVYCPFATYFGEDSTYDLWGARSIDLAQGEIAVYINSQMNTQARLVHYEQGTSYSLCAYVVGSGASALYPAPCNPFAKASFGRVDPKVAMRSQA